MIRAFFEGPAGSGKTHQLINEAVAAAPEVFVDPGQKLLALTFMNGARHRLNRRFGAVRELRGRFFCQTFDSFAGTVTHRRRALLRSLPPLRVQGDLNEFDRTCIEAARLIELPDVAAWVASSYPLIVVDEAQDLNSHRLRLLKAIATASCVIAAADEFQNLSEEVDSAPVVSWLRSAQRPERLTLNQRTSQDGLLRVAGALRNGTAVCAEIARKAEFLPCHVGPGFRMVEPHGKSGSVAWAVADELSKMSEYTVVLTPDGRSASVHQVIGKVQSQVFNKKDQRLGPYPLVWERKEDEEAARLLEDIEGEGTLLIQSIVSTVADLDSRYGRDICRRLDRIRNVRGETEITRAGLREVVETVIRDAARFGPRELSGYRVMTIQRAKNREFRHVLVLWPHSVMGEPEHQRRLLYNAVTRAKDMCSVVVFGRDRTRSAPFV